MGGRPPAGRRYVSRRAAGRLHVLPPGAQTPRCVICGDWRVLHDLHPVAVELLEDQAERDVGFAVERPVLAAGRQLDHGPGRVADRDSLEVRRAVIRLLGARGASRRPLRGRPARCAQAAGAPFGVELAGPLVLALRVVAGLLDRGAWRAARQAVMDRASAPCAAASRPPFGVLPALRLLAFLAARLASRSPLDGRALAAADTQPCLDPRLPAALAPGPGALPLHVGIRTAIGQPRCLAGGVVRAVRSSALLETILTG